MNKLIVVATLLVGLSGCDIQSPQPEQVPPSELPGAAEAVAAARKSHPDCVGPIATGAPKTVKIGAIEWELNGSTLKQKSATNGSLVIGALSDIKENSPENLANLEVFVKWFKNKKVDVIVVAGDSGLDQKEIEDVIGAVAELGVPVFNIIGNREDRNHYKQAMQNVASRHNNVFNLNAIRRIDMPAVDIVSLPGYFNESYIHAKDKGCAYYADDVKGLGQLVKASDSPVLLVSHGAPKQDGPDGIDRTAEGANVGDPALAEFMADYKVPFGIFGNVHEAGGRATVLSGKKKLPQGKPQSSLYLNPGPADGVRWQMNDRTESVGMAALLTMRDGKASYEIHRINNPNTRPKK